MSQSTTATLSIEPRILNQYAGPDDDYYPAESISDVLYYYEAILNDITIMAKRAREIQGQ